MENLAKQIKKRRVEDTLEVLVIFNLTLTNLVASQYMWIPMELAKKKKYHSLS